MNLSDQPARRQVLKATAAALLGTALSPVFAADSADDTPSSKPANPFVAESQAYPDVHLKLPTDALDPPQGPKKRIAAITTAYFNGTHADDIITKFINGYAIVGRSHIPHCQVVSLHILQTPAEDIGRGIAARARIRLCDSIADALTLGTDMLAVDGVLVIAEHGLFPYNKKGQQLYPRRELFEDVVKVFRLTGKSVPVYSDKHLSYSWDNAKWMYDRHLELGFAMMAGSSLPVTWRRPALAFKQGIELQSAISLGCYEMDAYGFHALETLQTFVEKRGKAAVGVKAVQCLAGDAAWEAGDKGIWRPDLLLAALGAIWDEPGVHGSVAPATKLADLRAREPKAIVFLIEYADGFQAATFFSPGGGVTNQFGFAAAVKGSANPVAAWCPLLQPQRDHFSFLCNHIEVMFRTGKASYPVERTLLVSGILAALFDSKYAGGKRIETPHLAELTYAPAADFGSV
ncbi:MAG TPA: hypothetical protein VIL86_17495 [Tepidisphaeraceae bacterium]|jgi:hypothetical protein